MNENSNAHTATPRTAPTGGYRPTLRYYHPNARGTGSVVEFELHPAHDNVAGSIFASMARQKTIGTREGGVRTFATFDWTNRVSVKLDIDDLSQILQVFRGMQESIADGKGLFHKSLRANTIIRLEHRLEPMPGYCLDISKKSAEAAEPVRIGIFFSPTEALGLSLAIEQSMDVIAFGIPMVIARETALEKTLSDEETSVAAVAPAAEDCPF